MARQPIPRLGPADRLKVQAAPVNSYVQPAETTGGADLLRALSSFTPALGQFADRMAADGKAKAEAEVEGKIGGMTFAQFKEARNADPAMGFTGGWARAALDKSYGTRLGHEVRRAVETELATADPMTADADEITARHVEEAQAQLGDSKFSVAGFQASTGGLASKAMDVLNGKRVQATIEVRSDNAAQNLLGAVEMGAEQGMSPPDLVAQLAAMGRQNIEVLGITPREQSKLMADVAATLAQRPGMEGYLAEIGNMEQDGVKLSTQLGPRFEAFKLQAEASSLNQQKDEVQPLIRKFTLAADEGKLDKAEFDAAMAQYPKIFGGAYGAQFEIRNTNAQQQALAQATARVQAAGRDTVLATLSPQLQDLIMQGRAADIQDVTQDVAGKSIDISRKDLKDYAFKQTAQRVAADGQAQGLRPEQVRANVVDLYGRNGEVDPDTEARVGALLHASTTGGDVPAAVINYLPELALVSQTAPHMLDQIVGNETDRLFVDTLTTSMELGNDAQSAMATAVWRRDNKALIRMPQGTDRTKTVASMIDKIDGGGILGQSPVVNPGLIRHFVESRLDYFYATGATGKMLTQKVEESFARTHVNLNGQLIDVSGTGLPPAKAQPIFAALAENIAQNNPAFAKDKITFIPLGRGSDRFKAVTQMGVPIEGTTRTWATMTKDAEKIRTQALLNKRTTKDGFEAGLASVAPALRTWK